MTEIAKTPKTIEPSLMSSALNIMLLRYCEISKEKCPGRQWLILLDLAEDSWDTVNHEKVKG